MFRGGRFGFGSEHCPFRGRFGRFGASGQCGQRRSCQEDKEDKKEEKKASPFKATFLRDVNFPDGSRVFAGQILVKE